MSKNIAVQLIPMDGVGGVETAAKTMPFSASARFKFVRLYIAGNNKTSVSKIGEIRTSSASPYDPRSHIISFFTLLKIQPRILICSLWRSIPIAIFFKVLRPRTRLVIFLHCAEPAHILDRLMHVAIFPFSDAIWADSSATLSSRAPQKRHAIGRIISFVLDQPVKPSGRRSLPEPSFVSWSRLASQKGIDRSIHLISALVHRGLDARYDVWGPDGGALLELTALRDRLGLQDRVRFRGPTARDSLSAIAAHHSFFLQLSRYEGMAMSVVEAMSFGLPPIVTAVGQMATYCRSGENSLVCRPDHLEETADALVEILADPVAYDKMRGAAMSKWRNSRLYATDVTFEITALL